MKKKLFHTILAFVLSLMLFIVVFSAPLFAWFTKENVLNLNITGKSIKSVLSYFENGTGSKGDPFQINSRGDIYHLAWLQNLGQFQKQKYYFSLGQNIDMDGLAIPPIGTDKYPFIGDFEGNKKVVSNLFVSNNADELKAQYSIPQSDLGSRAGFFGYIDTTVIDGTETAGRAANFYLENINVSNCVNDSYVGIVAGYNNGTLENIGVSNSSIKLANGILSRSEFTLIGELGSDTIWEDFPADLGSKILVDPNDIFYYDYLPLVTGNIEVKDSIPNHAYMTSELNTMESGNNGLYRVLMTTKNDSEEGLTTYTYTDFSPITADNIDSYKFLPPEFWTAYSTSNSKTKFIMPNIAPSYNNLTSVTHGGGEIDIPKNGIWFKPKITGNCGISFAKFNQSDNTAMSIFQFKRNDQGGIINWHENRFVLGGNLTNRGITYYEFEVAKGYEYVVGRSTDSPNPGAFFYLILGGAGYSGEVEYPSSTQQIDYVMRDENDMFPVISENYIITKTFLSFEGTSSSEGYMYFDKATHNELTAVYYYSAVGDITITENVVIDEESELAQDSSIFLDWMSQYLNTS